MTGTDPVCYGQELAMIQCNDTCKCYRYKTVGMSSFASCLHSRHLINHHVHVNSEVVYTYTMLLL